MSHRKVSERARRGTTGRRVFPAPERLEDHTLLSPAPVLARTASAKSIKHPRDIGTVLAGQGQTLSGSVGNQRPRTDYELHAESKVVVHAALSVLKGDATLTMMDGNKQVIASLTLSGNATEDWTLGPGTYYIDVARAGKAPARYQLALSATAPPAPTNPQPGNPSNGSPGNPSNGNLDTPTNSDTATGLDASPRPSVFGQAVTLTASVRALSSGHGVPDGTVTFLDGSSTLGTGTLYGKGTTSFSTSSLSVGTHAITAVYSSHGDFNGSGSSSLSVEVDPANSATTIALDNARSVYGQQVSLTATVSAAGPGAGIPGGTVTFMDSSGPLGVVPLSPSGTAALLTSSLSVGTHTIAALFTGDENFQQSQSPALSQEVDSARTATAVAVDVAQAVYGQPVTFTATVSAVGPGGGIPTGLVAFIEGTSRLGTGMVDGKGMATFSTSTLDAGSHTIAAVYLGDANFQPSASRTAGTSVGAAGTTAQISPSASPVDWKASVSFTATVAARAPGGGTPTGSVQFQIDGANFGAPVALVNGTATSGSTGTLSIGDHTITASYLSDSPDFLGGTMTALPLTVHETIQQFQAGLMDTIKHQVDTFALYATAVEASPKTETIDWYPLSFALLKIDSEVLNNQYFDAFSDIQSLGSALFLELFNALTYGGKALLEDPIILQDLQDLGALHEMSYGFLFFLANKLGSQATATPAVWTGGLLNSGNSGLASQYPIFTTQSASDWAFYQHSYSMLDAGAGAEGLSDQLSWNVNPSDIAPQGSYSNPSSSSMLDAAQSGSSG
jgi:hypothetical protein